jgi:hypothetical protein
MLGSPEGRLDTSFRLILRLLDEAGELVASDELEAEQTIELVEPPDDFGEPDVDGPNVDGGEYETYVSMRLEDFQTVFDELRLAPANGGSVSGFASGHLYGFERSVGRFEIEVCPAR